VIFQFNAERGMIIVRAEVFGPDSSAVLRLALDTGATATMISQSRLLQIGCDPSTSAKRLQITTASGVEFVPRVTLNKIVALGTQHTEFAVLAHTLPPSASIDGLLGLDFLRGLNLNLDFRNGLITLA
jgi:predicted aspartyl protease